MTCLACLPNPDATVLHDPGGADLQRCKKGSAAGAASAAEVPPRRTRTQTTPIASLLVLVFGFALSAAGQCPPLTESAKLPAAKVPAPTAQPEFFDEPSFTVAGVTDSTNLG